MKAQAQKNLQGYKHKIHCTLLTAPRFYSSLLCLYENIKFKEIYGISVEYIKNI